MQDQGRVSRFYLHAGFFYVLFVCAFLLFVVLPSDTRAGRILFFHRAHVFVLLALLLLLFLHSPISVQKEHVSA